MPERPLIGGERHREWPEAGKAAQSRREALPCRPLSIGKLQVRR
jgi:hypothetical protein